MTSGCAWLILRAKKRDPKSNPFERETGIEPATLSLARRCSTAEPLAHILLLCQQQDVYYHMVSYLSTVNLSQIYFFSHLVRIDRMGKILIQIFIGFKISAKL